MMEQIGAFNAAEYSGVVKLKLNPSQVIIFFLYFQGKKYRKIILKNAKNWLDFHFGGMFNLKTNNYTSAINGIKIPIWISISFFGIIDFLPFSKVLTDFTHFLRRLNRFNTTQYFYFTITNIRVI